MKNQNLKNLPIGISTLEKIINEDYLYIDKTQEAYEVITKHNYVFLSRPRRFGKSLFVDTLREIFEGNRELFSGLYIEDKWDWTHDCSSHYHLIVTILSYILIINF